MIFRKIIYGFKNLWKWKSIIWNDRDWDYSYLYIILEKKLQGIRKSTIDSNYVVTNEVRDITICINLIKKIMGEEYMWEYREKCEKEYHFDDTDEPQLKQLVITEKGECDYDWYFLKYKSEYRKAFKNLKIGNIDNGEYLAIHMAHEIHNKAKQLLFKILAEKLNSWWN